MLKRISAIIMSMFIAASLLAGMASCSMPQNIFTDQNAADDNNDNDDSVKNLYEFEFTMDNKLYYLPADFDYFVEKGWSFDAGETEEADTDENADAPATDDEEVEEKVDPAEFVLESGAYSDYFEVYDENKTYCIKLKFYNDTPDATTLNLCRVVGIKLDALNSSVPYTQFGGDIEFGSSYRKVVEAYGDPSFEQKVSAETGALVSVNDMTFDENAEGSANKKAYYYMTENSFVQFTFGIMENISDSLIDVTIENSVAPEKEYNYEKDREKSPDVVALYDNPDLLGQNITDFSFKYENNLYTLPIPVSEIIDDGWEFARGASTVVRSGTTEKGVVLRKGNLFIELMVHNYDTEKSQTAINCYAVSLSVGVTGPNAKILMPKGITIGSDASELETAYTTPFLSSAASINGSADTTAAETDTSADETETPTVNYMYDITEPVSDPLTANTKQFINKLETEDYIMYSYVMPDDVPTVTIPDDIKKVTDPNAQMIGTYRKHIDIYVSKANNKVVYVYMQNCPEFVVDEAAIWAEQLAQAAE